MASIILDIKYIRLMHGFISNIVAFASLCFSVQEYLFGQFNLVTEVKIYWSIFYTTVSIPILHIWVTYFSLFYVLLRNKGRQSGNLVDVKYD